MKNGFSRLKGIAAAGTMGIGALFAATGRAATVATGTSVTVSTIPGPVTIAGWTGIGTGRVFTWSSATTTGGFSATSGQSAFGISDGWISGTGYHGDAFDQHLSLAVNNTLYTNPVGTVDLTGTTVTAPTVTGIVTGIDASIQYHFYTDRPVVRAIYTLTNTTGAPIAVNALVNGNYGSDGNTTVQATSSGDTTITDADMWVVTNDNTTLGSEGGDPTNTLIAWGGLASIKPVNAIKPGTANGPNSIVDNVGLRYDMTIPANTTYRVMVFHAMTETIAQGQAYGASLATSKVALSNAGLVSDLTQQELDSIVNFGSASAPPASGGKKGGGAFALPTLLGSFGALLLGAFRRRNRS